jgi:molecular chaperone GrpE
MEENVAKKVVKKDELIEDLQRIQADFVNYKRRAEAEKAELLDFAKSRIVKEFLPVRDNFDREASSRPSDINPEWAKSIDSIRSGFDAVLKNLGVERFNSLGEVFDPHLHEAIAMDDSDGAIEVVSEELQAGYKLGDQVIRHAMVRVKRINDETIKENK